MAIPTPTEARVNTDRLGCAGSGAITVPRLHSYYTVLRLPMLRRPPLRFPSQTTYHGAHACSCSATRAWADTWRVGDFITGSPYHRNHPWRGRGLPGCWVILYERALVVSHPAGKSSPLPNSADDSAAFRNNGALGYPGTVSISGPQIPQPARSLPYCFARPVTGTHARARFWPAGLSFGQAGLAPAGRLTVFQEVSPPPIPTDQALPGRIR